VWQLHRLDPCLPSTSWGAGSHRVELIERRLIDFAAVVFLDDDRIELIDRSGT
jgi:hypothetical protein